MRRRWLLPFAVLIAFALSLTTAAAADLDSYRASLEDAQAALSGANPDVGQALTTLNGIETITLDDGSTVAPDLSTIIAMLEAEPADVAAAQQGIDALLIALELAERGPPVDGDAARDALDRVLLREEFQTQPEEDESRSIWQRAMDEFWNAISSALDWLSRKLGGATGEGSPLSVALAILGVLAVIGIVAFAVRSVRSAMSPGVTRLAENGAEEYYTSAEARAEAERLFAAGDFRAALRLLYLATLIRWEEAGRLRFDRSLTNREVVARVTVDGDRSLLDQLTPLVERFDRVWYGQAACTAEDYQRFASLADRAWERTQ